MPIQLDVAALVLLAAVLHASWNALVKVGKDRLLTMTVIMGVGLFSVVLLPFVQAPARESWLYLFLSVVIHGGYYFFLIQAYRVGDLSHVYPIARGAAPLLVAGGAAFFADEYLSGLAVSGLLLASTAIASLAFANNNLGQRDLRPFLFGFGTSLFIAAYTVVDGLGVRASGSPLGYIGWLFFLDGFPLILFAAATRQKDIGPYLRAYWKPGLIAGLMAAAGYGLVIWALSLGPMAYISALRETSVIFAAIIGAVLLHESFGPRRIAAAAVVASGIVLMSLAG